MQMTKGDGIGKIFKIPGQEDQVEAYGLVEECCNVADMETRRPGFNASEAAKNEASNHMKKFGG